MNRQTPLSALSRTFSLTLSVLLCVSLSSVYLCSALLIGLNNKGERGHWHIPGVTSVCFISPTGTISSLQIGHNEKKMLWFCCCWAAADVTVNWMCSYIEWYKGSIRRLVTMRSLSKMPPTQAHIDFLYLTSAIRLLVSRLFDALD